MTLLIGLTLTLIGSIIWYNKAGWDDEIWPMILASFTGLALFMALILLPIQRLEIGGKIEAYKSIQESFNAARESKDNIERFSQLKEIIEANRWLTSMQYYNNTMIDIYIPDEIELLKPIK